MDMHQAIQHEEYGFPYHYLVQLEGESFRSYRSWGWSLQYVTALELVFEKLRASRPASHIDIGCGDGALLSYLSKEFPTLPVVGVDYDEHAIQLARTMSPGIDYQFRNIITDPLPEKFASGSMIEVFEHIPPDLGQAFLEGASKLLQPGASLLMTVPHANKPLIAKHYRHFDFDLLRSCVSPFFEVKEMFAFERPTFAKKLAERLARKGVFIESGRLNRYLLKQQLAMRSPSEAGYYRIFAELVAR
jgi:SAM-dependent methyltransferase